MLLLVTTVCFLQVKTKHYRLSIISVGRVIFYDVYLTYDAPCIALGFLNKLFECILSTLTTDEFSRNLQENFCAIIKHIYIDKLFSVAFLLW